MRFVHPALVFGLALTVHLNGQELRLIDSSGSISLQPSPIEAFFETDVSVDFAVSGNPETLVNKNVSIEIFQRGGKVILPLVAAQSGGKVTITKEKTMLARVTVPIPKFRTRTRLIVKTVIEGTKKGKLVYIDAIPDDIIAELATRKIRVTGSNSVLKAFSDRGINAVSVEMQRFQNDDNWNGIWFIQLSGDQRKNFTPPTVLEENQIIVLLEEDAEILQQVIARQRASGWIIQLDRDWFSDFSTNAAAQDMFLNLLNKLTKNEY